MPEISNSSYATGHTDREKQTCKQSCHSAAFFLFFLPSFAFFFGLCDFGFGDMTMSHSLSAKL